MKAGRQVFQETSVHRIFIESCDTHLLEKFNAFTSLQEFIDMFLLNRSAIFQRRVFVWGNVKCRGFRLMSFTESNALRLARY